MDKYIPILIGFFPLPYHARLFTQRVSEQRKQMPHKQAQKQLQRSYSLSACW